MSHLTRRELLQVGMAGLGTAAVSEGQAAAATGEREFTFHHDHLLGTSLDLRLITPSRATAELAEARVLDEIERLRRIFSPVDPESELSRLNRTLAPMTVSPEMIVVLREYERWRHRTDGAMNGQVAALMHVWADAQTRGIEPSEAVLSELVQAIGGPAWHREESRSTVTRLSRQPLNLNSIAKGFILGRVAAILQSEIPSGLVNLGGDLCGWGDADWCVGVQDPHSPFDNARPITALRLTRASVATSGGYLRYHTIGGRRHSHLIDPRSGRPADGVAGATVVAADSVTANTLATTLCVLRPEEGLRLVAATPGAECLIIDQDRRCWRSPGLPALETGLPPTQFIADEKKPDNPWPADFQVTISLELPRPNARARRPYVAVWIEDSNGKVIRTVTVWGNAPRWLPELSGWWKFARNNRALVKDVTRATRAPGKYDVVWDGKDDKEVPVPQGTYTVRVEVHREHGKHLYQTGKIDCGTKPARATMDKNAETGETIVEYSRKPSEKNK